jgi:hypothetical protein
MNHKSMNTKTTMIAALVSLAMSAGSVSAAITLVTAGPNNLVLASATANDAVQNITFNAGALADAVIVVLSSESNASSGQASISYAGIPMIPVINMVGNRPSIWYLNLGGTSYAGGDATLALNLTGVSSVNGYGMGLLSVNAGGLDIAAHALSTANAKSVNLTTTVETFVVAGHRANSPSGGAPPQSPLSQLYSAQIGSSQGGAGYQQGVAAGTATYTFGGSTTEPISSAVAFAPVPEPSTPFMV